jgi:hypothetical protein
MYKSILFVPALMFLSSNSFADQMCTGKVTQVAVHSSGELRITTDFKASYFAICNVNGTWNNVATTTCMAWLSQVELAYKNNMPIQIYYPTGTNCGSFSSSGNAPMPNYIINYVL